MASKRQQIMDAVDARLKSITTANGYQTDIGKNVFAWRAFNFDVAECPALNYRDISRESSAQTVGYHLHIVNVEVEVIAAKGSTTADEVRRMVSDLYRAIGTDPKWGGLALYTSPAGDEMTIEQQEQVIGGARLRFSISYNAPSWMD